MLPVLSAGLTALLIFLFVKRFTEDKVIAPLSALIYLGFGMVYGIGTFSVLDSQTTLFISGAIITFYLGYSANNKLSLNWWLAVCGIFTGCAFMTKGFIAFAVMAVAIAPFLIWQKEWKKLFTMAMVPIIFRRHNFSPLGVEHQQAGARLLEIFFLCRTF